MNYKFLFLIVLMSLQNLHSQRTILWSIKKADSPKTSYVLGTFHQMGNSFVDEKPLIAQLLSTADVAVFESVEKKSTAVVDFMLQRQDDFSYRESLDKNDVDFLERFSATWKVPISKVKPKELLVKLEQEYALDKCGTVKASDTMHHMDDYIELLARKQNIETYGLETFGNQIDAINSNPEGETSWADVEKPVHYLSEVLQSDKDQRRRCALAKNYMKMKLDYQFDVKCAQNDPILINRNEKWMPQIINLLQEKNSIFISVGLFHLYGKCGIISQLRNQGYTIKEVQLK